MKRMLSAFAAAVLVSAAQGGNVSLPRFPAVSPDGAAVTFSWRGDLWIVPTAGGEAKRLTSHPSDELYSSFGRDGKQIAFTSTRFGPTNLFVMNVDGTNLKRVFNTDRPIALWSFTNYSGKPILAISGRLELDEYSGARSYAVGLNGGEPWRLFDAFGTTPSVSPDGTKILFTRGASGWERRGYRGPDARDVWLYDRGAKTYTQITKWNGNDGRAKWIDNNSFVFASDRDDKAVNLYRLSIGSNESEAQKLTNFTVTDAEDFDISADGKTLVMAMWDRLYRIDLTKPDGGPVAIEITANEDSSDRIELKSVDRSVSEAALSPDGKAVAVIAYGQVFVRGADAKSPTRRITQPSSRHGGLAWSPDGQTLYFHGDETGAEAIYAATVKTTRGDVKKRFDEATKKPGAQPATAPTETTEEKPKPESAESTTEESKPKDDEKKTETGGEAKGPEARKKETSRWADAITFEVKPLISNEYVNADASTSPDGKYIAYRRGAGQLRLFNLKTKEDRVLVDGWSESLSWRWSPDSRHIAYVTEDVNNNADVWITPIDGSSAAVNISQHPDNESLPRWSADGKILAFLSTRVNNESDVYTVFLDKSLENLTPAELEKYYEDAGAAVKKREPPKAPRATTRPTTMRAATTDSTEDAKDTTQAATTSQPSTAKVEPVVLDLEDAYLRLRRLTSMPGNEGSLEISPAGDRYIFTAQSAAGASAAPTPGPGAGGGGGGRATFSVDKDGGDPKRIAANTNPQHFNLTGDKLVVVEGNRAATMKLPTGELEYLDISDRLTIDLAKQSEQKFLEASRALAHGFYDANMNGLDWPALTQRYAELARLAVTPNEFDHVADKFVGELNSSHQGVTSPDRRSELTQPMGRLGIRRVREGNAYKVTEIFEQGPAGKGAMKLVVGDVITAVNGEGFEESDTLESKLQGMVGKEVALTVRRSINDAEKEIDLLITPISPEAESRLFYDDWRTETAQKVAEMSGGKIGYIHIRGMDQNSLDVFERDLYAAANGKKGLIIDVRNNGGGWTADRLLASIMFPRHAYTRPRGVSEDVKDAYPNDRLFIAKYDLPINMLCNEKSFSNAEIISHAFKNLKRGTLVGQQTAGGVISTGGISLIDGTTVRMPGRGWWTPAGVNMELNGAMPDLLVPQTPEAEAKDADEQLKAAVDDLLKRL